MAKKRGGTRRRKYIKGKISEQEIFTSLAAADLVSQTWTESVRERTWISSIVASWSMHDFTPILDVGPIMVGVAHGDYNATEIEEYIETTGSWDEGDLVQQEVMKRKIRIVGVFEGPDAATDVVVLNDGKPIRTKCGWILNGGVAMQHWVYNLGSQAVATTTPEVRVEGHANLWPQ